MRRAGDRERWIRRLRRVLRDMPDDVWLYASDSLYVMQKTPDGKHAMVGGRITKSVDQDAILASFDIDADGGDW